MNNETLAFHRGVDAAKQAIRDEIGSASSDDAHFYAASFITAIARRCGIDRDATPSVAITKDSELSADLGVSPVVAKKLLALREIIARAVGFSEDAEAWQVLYSIADPRFESLTPWAGLETLASTSVVFNNSVVGTESSLHHHTFNPVHEGSDECECGFLKDAPGHSKSILLHAWDRRYNCPAEPTDAERKYTGKDKQRTMEWTYRQAMIDASNLCKQFAKDYNKIGNGASATVAAHCAQQVHALIPFASQPATSGAEAWQPIETAPKGCVSVLLGSEKCEIVQAGYADFADTLCTEGHKPTQWMPLPLPPRVTG